MTEDEAAVAKARIVLVDGSDRLALMSRKRAEGKSKHGKLEMLGGHLEAGESPLQALLRELREEETSGTLARLVERARPTPREAVVVDTLHHLFEIELPAAACSDLQHDPTESLGFVRVPLAELADPRRGPELTWRTERIFEVFGATPP